MALTLAVVFSHMQHAKAFATSFSVAEFHSLHSHDFDMRDINPVAAGSSSGMDCELLGAKGGKCPLFAELGFNAFFTLELILRAISSGGPKAYLSNAWNIFDLCMVLAGYTEFLPASWFGECARLCLNAPTADSVDCFATCFEYMIRHRLHGLIMLPVSCMADGV